MADPVTIAAVAAGASGFLGFKDNRAAAKAARQTAEYNAQVKENEAVLLQRAKIEEENSLRQQSERLEGTQRVATAASGTSGEIRATNDITAFYSSDVALKENIENISSPMDKVQNLNGVLFDWKQEFIDAKGGEDGYFVRKRDVGVVAQDVEKVLPEVVGTRPDGVKAVKYDRLCALLIECVKDLQDQVNDIKKDN